MASFDRQRSAFGLLSAAPSNTSYELALQLRAKVPVEAARTSYNISLGWTPLDEESAQRSWACKRFNSDHKYLYKQLEQAQKQLCLLDRQRSAFGPASALTQTNITRAQFKRPPLVGKRVWACKSSNFYQLCLCS